MHIIDAMKMMEELLSDNEMSITTLSPYGEEIATLLYAEVLRLITIIEAQRKLCDNFWYEQTYSHAREVINEICEWEVENRGQEASHD
jgi:hypothetical protein